MISVDSGIDLIGYDASGQIILIGEVKSRLGTSEEWAAEFRRNILAHGTTPHARFFLIGTPEHLYFWKEANTRPDDSPDFKIETSREFKPYFEEFRQLPATINNESLKLLIQTWLGDIITSKKSHKNPALRWLSESGLIPALEQGRVEIYPYR